MKILLRDILFVIDSLVLETSHSLNNRLSVSSDAFEESTYKVLFTIFLLY